MEYIDSPNLVLEALIYLGLRADQSAGIQRLEERFRSKGGQDLAALRRLYAPFQQLQAQLNQRVSLPQDVFPRRFMDLPGFPYDTNGNYSPALLLCAPAAYRCGGDWTQFLKAVSTMTQEQAAHDLLISLDLGHLLGQGAADPVALLVQNIDAMSLPAKTRRALMDVCRRYRAVVRDTVSCLQPVINTLETMLPELQRLADGFTQEIQTLGCDDCLQEISNFHRKNGGHYCLRPLLMDPVSNLFIDEPAEGGGYVVYCGVLRYTLRRMELSARATLDQIYEAIRLLGDRTRFDIFCYLQNHPAYGQELSNHFGLARNTIHHHMTRLFKAGLVTCTVEGTRVYYAIDSDRYSNLLDQQRQMLLCGYCSQKKPAQ